MQDNFVKELLDQYENLKRETQNQNYEQVVKISVDMVSIAKVLVNIHNYDEFILVDAQFRLGQAYLNFECIQQSIDHLSQALEINDKLFNSEESKNIHIQILIIVIFQFKLSDAYFQNKQIDISQKLIEQIDILQRSLKVQTFTYVYRIKSKIKYSQNKVQEASELLIKCIEKNDDKQQLILTYIDLSKIQQINKQYDESFQTISKALELINSLEYYDQETHINFLKQQKKSCIKSSQYQENINLIIEINKKIIDIKSKLDTQIDRKILKLQSQIADAYTQQKKIDEAVDSLKTLKNFECQMYEDHEDERILITNFKIIELQQDQDLEKSLIEYQKIQEICQQNNYTDLNFHSQQKIRQLTQILENQKKQQNQSNQDNPQFQQQEIKELENQNDNQESIKQ